MTDSIYQPFPKSFYSIIRNCKIILGLSCDHVVTYNDVSIMKDRIYNYINVENLSPSEIAKKYNIETKSYHIFISKTLGIKLKSVKNANINYLLKNNLLITDEKEIYKRNCKFTFSPYDEPNILGYELLSKYSFSTPQNKNPNEIYLHRDHMISISYGWENNIPSEHISHPANCEILTEKNNISKGSRCSITYEDLLYRIKNWNLADNIKIDKIVCEKSKTHRENISRSLKIYHQHKKSKGLPIR